MGLKMNVAKTKVMVVDNTPINVNNVLIENVEGYVYLGQHYSLKENNQDKNHGRLGGIRHALLGYHQKQPCDLHEETGVQLMCAASYDIWCRDLDTDQTSTEQTCGRTDQNGKKYSQHHIQGQKDQHVGQGENKSHRHNQSNVRKMKAGQGTRTASKTTDGPHVLPLGDHVIRRRPERPAKWWRPAQILERHDLAQDSVRLTNLETAC